MGDTSQDGFTASRMITNQIGELTDWRGSLMARLRALILETSPGITEEWKWGTAGWSQNGHVLSAGVFKDHVKLNFAKGASLDDPDGLFNAGLEAKISRAIDFYEGDEINIPAVKKLIYSAVAVNQAIKK